LIAISPPPDAEADSLAGRPPAVEGYAREKMRCKACLAESLLPSSEKVARARNRGPDRRRGPRFYWLLSTWDPYQVTVMQSELLLTP
jgi:hypothetical protein